MKKIKDLSIKKRILALTLLLIIILCFVWIFNSYENKKVRVSCDFNKTKVFNYTESYREKIEQWRNRNCIKFVMQAISGNSSEYINITNTTNITKLLIQNG